MAGVRKLVHILHPMKYHPRIPGILHPNLRFREIAERNGVGATSESRYAITASAIRIRSRNALGS